MKQLISVLCLLLPFFQTLGQNTHDETLIGQRAWRVPPLPVEDGQIVYRDAIRLEGISSETLYKRALNWLQYNLKTDDQSITPNKKDGSISGRGKITYNQNIVASNAIQGIYFDYDIQVSDGGYTYDITNLQGVLSGKRLDYSAMCREELNNIEKPGQWTHKYRYEMLSDAHSFVTLMIQSLKNAMIKD